MNLNTCETRIPDFIIRSTTLADIPSIVETATAAFTCFTVFGPPWCSDAGVLPALLSGMPGYDPTLSRVAQDPGNGRILGHAQWTLCNMYLAGRTRETAYLGPLSVHPDFQSRGIGGALMRDGISLLVSRGVEMLFILGHERYYPRFGFRSRVIGVRACEVPLPPGPAVLPEGAEIRPFICGDEIHFRNMWSVAFMEAEGAMDPGPGILPWTSKTKGILSVTLEIRGKVAGHARVDSRQGCEHPILRFLAVDPETARMLLGWILGQLQWKATVIRLPLPDASGLFPESRFVHERWDAGMALSLSADPAVDAALDCIISGEAPPLAIDFPTMFDF